MSLGYTIKELTEEEFLPLFDKHKATVFSDVHNYTLPDLLSDAEKDHQKILGQAIGKPYTLYLGAFNKNNEFIGWSWGTQENNSTFYMVNYGVLKEYRRKGIYSALISKCVDILSQKGFQIIYSRHCATNNAAIIPKLKAGFIISKMEIDDRFGILVHLHFYTNKVRRKIMEYRTGQLKPDEEIKNLFKV